MSEELTPPRFPTMLRKMWSGGEVQAWIDENWNRRAHPAAPADAAPSVAPEPVAQPHRTMIEDFIVCIANAAIQAPDASVHALLGMMGYSRHPPRAPLTEEHVTAVVRSVCGPNLAETSKAWRDLVVECRYWLEAANGIGGK